MNQQIAESIIRPFVETLLKDIARDRRCNPSDLSVGVLRAAEHLALQCLEAGQRYVLDEPTGEHPILD